MPKPSKPAPTSKIATKVETTTSGVVMTSAPAKANGSSNGSRTVGQAAATPGTLLKGSGTHVSSGGSETTNQLLTRAEQDIASAIDSLNNQMNTALTALAELASAKTEHGKAVVRTAPLDRATATFQRLVAEVVDDQLAEMLPPLIALRNETGQWAAGGEKDSPESDFHRRGVETLDHVLALAGVTSFDARPGQTFDPLIHLAVGESRRDDLADGAVAECLQPGFRSSRGKVLSPVRVRINRR
jgi:molecular chaperone GrpE (heat shock protein)